MRKRRVRKGISLLASQSILTWNQIVAWLREMETFECDARNSRYADGIQSSPDSLAPF